MCEDFLHGYQGHACGAPDRSVPGRLRAGSRCVAEFVRRRELGPPGAKRRQGLLGSSGAAACPRPLGGSPPVAGTAAAPSPPHPQTGGTGRNGPATPRPRAWPGRPPRAGQSLTGEDHHQGRAQGHVPATRGRPLTLIFPGKTSAPIRRTGAKTHQPIALLRNGRLVILLT
jgi:hypothetical protein